MDVPDAVDLTGKTVHPFVTHAVSGMNRIAEEHADVLCGATVTDGLASQGEEAASAAPQVEQWLRRTGVLRCRRRAALARSGPDPRQSGEDASLRRVPWGE